jgi:hypothetical protein
LKASAALHIASKPNPVKMILARFIITSFCIPFKLLSLLMFGHNLRVEFK